MVNGRSLFELLHRLNLLTMELEPDLKQMDLNLFKALKLPHTTSNPDFSISPIKGLVSAVSLL